MGILQGDCAPVNWSVSPESQSSELVDQREQLVNSGDVGPIERVSLPVEMTTSLRGILLDVDPGMFKPPWGDSNQVVDPTSFFNRVIEPMLARNAVLAKAEVRVSGRGLHVILRFENPVVFQTDADRRRWAAIVRLVQRLLPTDPDCPGITALTRPVGSVNSKNNSRVESIRAGKSVTEKEILELVAMIQTSRFRTIAQIMFGGGRLTPCPICNKPDSRLDALDCIGKCYGSCGNVKSGQLFDVFLAPRHTKGGGR